MWIYLQIFLVTWTSCSTSVTGPQVIGSSQPVKAKVGDDVILPCHIEPPVNVENRTVKWTRVTRPDVKLVDSWRQDHRRTSLFPEQLSRGNISLKMSRVKLSDQGRYKCSVPHLGRSSEVQLLVGALSQPVISLVGSKAHLLSWRCDSGCWFPEPEMSWLDSDGKNITAGPSVTEKRSDHCYVVQRSVTVALTEHVTCRVHLPHISHTVEITSVKAESESVKQQQSSLSAAVIAAIVLTVIAVIVVVTAIAGYFYLKKQRQTIPSGSNEMNMSRVSGEEEPLKDDITPSPSPKPREWRPVSNRWRPQLEKLVNADDCDVTKVGGFVFGNVEEFRIAKGSDGDEVFLGLKDDGTEVAVKRTTKLNDEVLKKEQDLLSLPHLDDPSIVRYLGFVEDKNFAYLVLELCEYDLEEYLTKHNLCELEKKQLAEQVLKSLSILHCHDPTILHRDIKPQNVLIDIRGKAKLADFGISRPLPEGQTSALGPSCWKAKETLDANSDAPYTRSTDIQVAGMLIYYILSGGDHPFGSGAARGAVNIKDGNYTMFHIHNVVAKDLIERMINEDPNKRRTVAECLAHGYFWSNDRKVEFLRRMGNMKEVENCRNADKTVIRKLDQHAKKGEFNLWKDHFPTELLQKLDGRWRIKTHPENSFGLLRFIHTLHERYAEDESNTGLLEKFPDLFSGAFETAKDQGWSSRPSLKDMFTSEDAVKSPKSERKTGLSVPVQESGSE